MFPLLEKSPEFNIYELIATYKDYLNFPRIWKLYNNQTIREVSHDCRLALEAAVNLLFTGEIWPIQMIDAWGKLPEGILSGHIAMMGDFQECMLLSGSVVEQNVEKTFGGRYCPMHLVIGAPNSPPNYTTKSIKEEEPLYTISEEMGLLMTQPTLAACLPASCSRDDFNTFFSPLASITNGLLNPITSYCQTNESPPVDGAVITMITLCAILLLLTLIASLMTILPVGRRFLTTSPQPIWYRTLMAFSLPTNLGKLVSTADSSENFGCLHGLRFLSICWVVLGHTWSILTYTPIWNMWRIGGFHSPWTLLTIVNGTFSVDTFFTLAGFLIGYQLLKALDRTGGKFKPVQLSLHRYLRITPTYAFLIGIVATLQPFAFNGPMWGIIEMNSKYCRRNWWQNILYVNNLLDHHAMEDPTDIPCFGEAWYLGCDMQFFLVSIWVVALVSNYRRIGVTVLVMLTVGSVVIPGWIIGSNNLIPINIPFRLPTGKETGNYDLDVYVKPWTRYGPYIAGIWAGLAYFHTQKRSIRLPSYIIYCGWILSTGIALGLLYGPNRFFNVEIPLGKIESVVYGGMARTAWGVAIGWIIYACITGHGGFINKWLSIKLFMPLGRITFCVFLTSYELQQMFHARYPHPLSYDIYFLVNLFLAHLGLSLLIGFWLTLLIESPFINLGKLILGK